MDVHPILLVDGRSNVVLEVIGGDPDVNTAGDFERFPFLGCHIVLSSSATGGRLSVGLGISGLSGRGRLCGLRQPSLGYPFGLLCIILFWEGFLAKVLNDLECGFPVNLKGPVGSIIYGNNFAGSDLLNVLLQVANATLAAIILDENIHSGRIEDDICILQT